MTTETCATLELHKKGKLEKKYWDQVQVMSPCLRGMFSRYVKHFGHPQFALEKAIDSVMHYLRRPYSLEDGKPFARTFISVFIANAALEVEHDFDEGKQEAAKMFVLSRIVSQQILLALDDSGEGNA